jgi:hypothetical protein
MSTLRSGALYAPTLGPSARIRSTLEAGPFSDARCVDGSLTSTKNTMKGCTAGPTE